jgi:glutamate dehydrogenase/leucine dehydrogenase
LSYVRALRIMVEPERVVSFRVAWTDDDGELQVNRGFRVQCNGALGPYKGGLRFHPSVNQGILKFLAFEQTFKNALTGLSMGGGKGGSDFNPKGRSDAEVMRFCQAFMTELSRHIGPDVDVPAGDIGVSGREIGFLFGQWRRMTATWNGGVLTGKGTGWGGSFVRTEATGSGIVYLTRQVLEEAMDDSLKDKRVAVSGAGNVALHTMAKLLELGAVPVTCSDSGGCIVEPDGFTREKLDKLMELKAHRKPLSEFPDVSDSAVYKEGERPWSHTEYDIAIPCATQNEVENDDAKAVADAGAKLYVEGANMPSTNDAIDTLKSRDVVFVPAKAANAGGVAVSGLEMAQNSARLQWSHEEVDEKLQGIMKEIFTQMREGAKEVGADELDFQTGANIAGFKRVADAVLAQGVL